MRPSTSAILAVGLLSAVWGVPSAIASPQIDRPQSYPSAQALADELNRHGHWCETRPTPDEVNDWAVDVLNGACAGVYVGLYIYGTPAARDANISIVVENLRKDGMQGVFLVGSNWAVNCYDQAMACVGMREDMGGTVVTARPAY